MWVDISSRLLRAACRVFFIIILALLGIVGQQCCKYAVKLRLQQGKSVKLSEMTGWVRFLPDLVVSSFQLRRLPGGTWLGLLMLVASLFTLVADISVNVLVTEAPYETRCTFTTGLVFDAVNTGKHAPWDAPPSTNWPARVALGAQWNSYDNNGLVGIYRKANTDSNFLAQYEDVMGRWDCSFNTTTHGPFSASLPDTQVLHSLTSSGCLSSVGNEYSTSAQLDGQTSHLVAWSASIADGDRGAFSVQIVVDKSGEFSADKMMDCYSCQIDPSTGSDQDRQDIDTVLAFMIANNTMDEWKQAAQQMIYDGDGSNASSYTQLYLEMTLNALTMVEGGNDMTNFTALPTDDPQQGCLVTMTWVSAAIPGLAGFIGIVFLSMIIYLIILMIRLRTGRSRSGEKGAPESPIPNNMVAWMLHATRESALGDQRGYPIDLEMVPDEAKKINEWEFNSVSHPGGHRHHRILRAGTMSSITSPGAPFGGTKFPQVYSTPVSPEAQPLSGGNGGEYGGGYGFPQSPPMWQGRGK